jgi:hypothetical protein
MNGQIESSANRRSDTLGRRRATRLGAVVAGAMVVGSGASAFANMIIVPTFDSTITSDPNAAAIEGVINNAIAKYQASFSDPITVNITFASMSSGLGQSSTAFFNVSYASVRTALTADASTADDAVALAHLPVTATDPVLGNSTINIKSANGRALGLSTAVASDGTISLNTHITDVGSPGTTGQFSLIATTEHEIDEVLGLGSSLPSIPFSAIFPEDLYRYTAAGARSFTTSSIATAFFSIDGTTDLAQFDNQNDGGDFGDWQSNPLPNGVQPKVQDAFATPGSTPPLGVELRALDVIGYNLIPEPASLSLLACGLLLPLRRGRRQSR